MAKTPKKSVPRAAGPPATKMVTKTAPAIAVEPDAAPSKFRNRNVGTRKVNAGELIAHPKNWRKHPSAQAGALRGVLQEVGFVGTLIARETPEGLQLIDGHLRAETLEDELVDVMVVDLADDEVDIILATHDPLGDVAQADPKAFDDLIRDLTISDGALSELLSGIVDDMDAPPSDRPGRDGAASDEGCEYPLTPVFNEKYEYAVIFCKNETDWGALQTILELEREKSYNTTGVSVGRVVPFSKFFELWSKWMGDGDEPDGSVS